MSQAEIAQKSPLAVAVEAGKSYWWCSCGKSKSQPFCDGSHQGSAFLPVEYLAEESSFSESGGASWRRVTVLYCAPHDFRATASFF